MKFAPSKFDRSFLLIALLAFMAWLVPQCWYAREWSNEVGPCVTWMVCFVALYLLTGIIAATKRQWLLGVLIGLTAVVTFFWWNDSVDMQTDYRTATIGTGVTGVGSPQFATGLLIGLYGCLFLFSFFSSFVLDQLICPVPNPESGRAAVSEPEDSESVSKPNRVRMLIAIVAMLFLLQSAISIAPINFSFGPLVATFLALGLWVVGSGLVCRLSAVPAYILLFLLVIASTGGTIAWLIHEYNGIPPWIMGLVFGLSVVVVGAAFLLLGRNKGHFGSRPGWLSVAVLVVACSVGFVGMSYDLHSLLLNARPFDWESAVYAKNLNANSNVRLDVYEADGPRGSFHHVSISFDGTGGADSFFDQLDASSLPAPPFWFGIQGMSETVNLDGLKKLGAASISFSKCKISSKQLEALWQLGASVSFGDCVFVRSGPKSDERVTGTSNVNFNGKPGPFFRAMKNVDVQGGIYCHCESMEDADIEAVLDYAEGLDENSSAINLYAPKCSFDPKLLEGRANLEKLMFTGINFIIDQDRVSEQPCVYAMLLKSNVGVEGFIENSERLWELVLAANGRFMPQIEFTNSRADYGQYEPFEDSMFAYAKTEEGDVEKLWIPWFDNLIVQDCAKLKSLESLSLDVGWSGNETLESKFSMSEPLDVDVSVLNGLTNLRELCFPSREELELSGLTGLEKLEVIQFPSSSNGFAADNFPKLKEVRVFIDSPIRNSLMKGLKKSTTLESLVLIDTHATTFKKEKFLVKSATFFDRSIKVSVVDVEDAGTLVPEYFRKYCEDTKASCIEKYLGEQ